MPLPIRSQVRDLPHEMTSTTFDIPGYAVVQSMGVVRGVVVRSRSVFGTVGGVQPSRFGTFSGLLLGFRRERGNSSIGRIHNE